MSGVRHLGIYLPCPMFYSLKSESTEDLELQVRLSFSSCLFPHPSVPRHWNPRPSEAIPEWTRTVLRAEASDWTADCLLEVGRPWKMDQSTTWQPPESRELGPRGRAISLHWIFTVLSIAFRHWATFGVGHIVNTHCCQKSFDGQPVLLVKAG